jgi:non-specific serine/threonine protein kinase
VPSNGPLAAELTSFVGRRRELADAARLLTVGRLVTLTGTGGVGKTRLAARLAAQSAPGFADGVRLVELAALHDPGLLAKTVGMAFGLLDAGDPAGRLVDHLRDKRLLLVLDNCEHLGEDCGKLVAQVLAGARHVRVLATSRRVLGVDGEHVYHVPPLAVPSARDHTAALKSDVVRLFAERAGAAVTGFTVDGHNWSQVVRICRRLDGIPLAVELAAVWLRTLSLEDLLDRLDLRLLDRGAVNSPSRQHTLLATIDWSHDLCTPGEQVLWARLSVFAGGFDLTAAEEVCSGDGIDRPAVLGLLAGLVDSSVVHVDGERYRMLETIREYGQGRLSGAHALRVRHRDHYLRLAEEGDRDVAHGREQADVYARVHREHANIRDALDFSLSTPGQRRTGLRMAARLHFYWLHCGHLTEGRTWLERALRLNPEPSRDRAEALWVTAYAVGFTGIDVPVVHAYVDEAEAWARAHGDEAVLAHATLGKGGCHLIEGDIDRAEQLFREAVTRFEACAGRGGYVLQALSALAHTQVWRGNPHEAVAIARRGLARSDALGEQFARTKLLYCGALGHWSLGEYEQAAVLVTESIRIARVFSDPLGAAMSMEILSWCLAGLGRHERAAELLGAVDQVWPSVGGRPMFGVRRLIDAHRDCADTVRKALGARRFQTLFTRGTTTGFDESPARRGVLSEREFEVAELVTQGLTNKEIAERLVISRRTAESHVVHILDKLGFSSRSQIATWVTELRHAWPDSPGVSAPGRAGASGPRRRAGTPPAWTAGRGSG